jgi:DNA-binding FadR family transcriptional regulator
MLIFTMPAPALTADRSGRLFAGWWDSRNGNPDVFLSRSPDGGRTWEPPIRLNDDPEGAGSDQYLLRLSVAGNGRVDAVFLDRRNDPRNLNNDAYLTYSTDNGRTFAPNIRITEKSSDSRIGQAYYVPSAKGLVESRPKVGTRVSLPERWHLLDPDVLSWIFEREPDDRLVKDLFELRRMVEPQAAALAAERRSESDLAAMAQALQDMELHSLAVEEGRDADQKFHAALLRASGNAFVASLISGIGAAVTWTTIFKQRRHQLARDPVPDHVRVYEAVRARNPAAAQRAMTALLDLALLDTTHARRPRKKR